MIVALPQDDFSTPEPLFHVGERGASLSTELQRQTAFNRDMRLCAPGVLVFANANAGKRNPAQARREGVKGGVFDLTCVWQGGCAWPELKGYQPKSRRWGTLSDGQIRWGNRMVGMGHHVACFYDPVEAIVWLKSLGAPVKLA